MRHRKNTKKRNQRGGVRFSDIITVENRERFIGKEIEIVRLNNFLPNETDFTGIESINNLMNLRGYIKEPTDDILDYFTGTGVLEVTYPNLNLRDSGNNLIILHIPDNLKDFMEDVKYLDRTDIEYLGINYYVKLKRPRGPDLFTRNEMLKTLDEHKKSKALKKKSRYGTRYGYIPSKNMSESMSDTLMNPDESRYLPEDIMDLLSQALHKTYMEDRATRRQSKYLD